mmetsp:Transcript_22970/g.50499  ORF Transcript_22970/g.50499 Transcript_22970/m.50499 type:complete len:281 (-) Transcript_22970:152-994(-)
MSTSSMGVRKSGSWGSGATAILKVCWMCSCMYQAAILPSFAASTVIVAPARSPPANSQGASGQLYLSLITAKPESSKVMGDRCARISAETSQPKAVMMVVQGRILFDDDVWYLPTTLWWQSSSSWSWKISSKLSTLPLASTLTLLGPKLDKKSVHSRIANSRSSNTARISVKDFRKTQVTRWAPQRKADPMQSNAVSPAPKTTTCPLSAGNFLDLDAHPALEASDTAGRNSLEVHTPCSGPKPSKHLAFLGLYIPIPRNTAACDSLRPATVRSFPSSELH